MGCPKLSLLHCLPLSQHPPLPREVPKLARLPTKKLAPELFLRMPMDASSTHQGLSHWTEFSSLPIHFLSPLASFKCKSSSSRRVHLLSTRSSGPRPPLCFKGALMPGHLQMRAIRRGEAALRTEHPPTANQLLHCEPEMLSLEKMDCKGQLCTSPCRSSQLGSSCLSRDATDSGGDEVRLSAPPPRAHSTVRG